VSTLFPIVITSPAASRQTCDHKCGQPAAGTAVKCDWSEIACKRGHLPILGAVDLFSLNEWESRRFNMGLATGMIFLISE